MLPGLELVQFVSSIETGCYVGAVLVSIFLPVLVIAYRNRVIQLSADAVDSKLPNSVGTLGLA